MAKQKEKVNTVEFYRDYAHWFWQFKFANGIIAAQCAQSYDSRRRCVAAAEEVIGCPLDDAAEWPNGQMRAFTVPRCVRVQEPKTDVVPEDPA